MYTIILKSKDTIDKENYLTEKEVLERLDMMKPNLKSRLFSLTTMDYGKNVVISVHNNDTKILELRTYIANGKIFWIGGKNGTITIRN